MMNDAIDVINKISTQKHNYLRIHTHPSPNSHTHTCMREKYGLHLDYTPENHKRENLSCDTSDIYIYIGRGRVQSQTCHYFKSISLFQVVSTVQQTRVTAKKVGPWLNLLHWKFENDSLYCLHSARRSSREIAVLWR